MDLGVFISTYTNTHTHTDSIGLEEIWWLVLKFLLYDPKMQFKASSTLAPFFSGSLYNSEPARTTLDRSADSQTHLKYYEDLWVEMLKFKGCLLYLHKKKICRPTEMYRGREKVGG